MTEPDLPDNYFNATFGPRLEAILAVGAPHLIPVFDMLELEFFGIAS